MGEFILEEKELSLKLAELHKQTLTKTIAAT